MSDFAQIYTCNLPGGRTWRVSVIPESSDVDFNLYIENPNGQEIAQDNSQNVDAYCTFTSLLSGTYHLKVKTVEGNCNFSINVEPVSIIYTQTYYHRLERGKTWKVSVIPSEPNVDFNLYIEDPDGKEVIQDSSPKASAYCTFTSTQGGPYSLRIESVKGVSDFKLNIEPISDN